MRWIVFLLMCGLSAPMNADDATDRVFGFLDDLFANCNRLQSQRYVVVATGITTQKSPGLDETEQRLCFIRVREQDQILDACSAGPWGWYMRFQHGEKFYVRTMPYREAPTWIFETPNAYMERNLQIPRMLDQVFELHWQEPFLAYKFNVESCHVADKGDVLAKLVPKNERIRDDIEVLFGKNAAFMPSDINYFTQGRGLGRHHACQEEIRWKRHADLMLPVIYRQRLIGHGRELRLLLRWKIGNDLGPEPLLNHKLDDWREPVRILFKETWEQHLAPDTPSVLSEIGRQHYHRGDFELAADYLSRAVKLDGDQAGYYNDLGLAYWKMKNHDAGREHLEKAVELKPSHTRYANNLASLHLDTGRETKAFEALEAAHRDPAVVHYNMAYLQARHEQFDEAMIHLNQSLSHNPNLNQAIRLRDDIKRLLD